MKNYNFSGKIHFHLCHESSSKLLLNICTKIKVFFSLRLQAYKLRQANSVKIAKIVAFTVILSSFILGSFMLASTYLQAKATCDQVSALDAILDKELMLETMQQVNLVSEIKFEFFLKLVFDLAQHQ
jgi:hypothetical protein